MGFCIFLNTSVNMYETSILHASKWEIKNKRKYSRIGCLMVWQINFEYEIKLNIYIFNFTTF